MGELHLPLLHRRRIRRLEGAVRHGKGRTVAPAVERMSAIIEVSLKEHGLAR